MILKECAVESYGVECRGICSWHCAGSTTCKHVTSPCDRGCDIGWEGSLCNKGIMNITVPFFKINMYIIADIGI